MASATPPALAILTERSCGAHRSINAIDRCMATNMASVSGSTKPTIAMASGSCRRSCLAASSVGPTVSSEGTMPRVLDSFQTYLRELRPSDLDGSAGLYRLREELTRRINVAVAPGRINAVLFKEMVIQ